MAGVASAQAGPTLSANDRRLIAIAAELLDIDVRANAMDEDAPGYDALIDRYTPFETEMAALPADTLVGLLAKARTSRIPAVAGCVIRGQRVEPFSQLAIVLKGTRDLAKKAADAAQRTSEALSKELRF